MAGHDVFISYSTLDKTSADAVCHGLEAEGVRCWMAPRDVTPGMDWQQSLLDAIGEAKAVVLVFTQNANESANVKKEITAAFEGGAVVIPFRLEKVEPQGSLRYHLTGVHWLDALTPPLDANVRQLAGNLKRLLASLAGREPPPPEPVRPLPPPPPDPKPTLQPRGFVAPPRVNKGPNWGLIIAGGLGALVVCGMLAIALGGNRVDPNVGQQQIGGMTPVNGSGPQPPAVAVTPEREEALLNLRTPIENMPEFANEFDQAPGGPPLTVPGGGVVATQQLGFAVVNGAAELTLIDALGCNDHPSLPTARCLEPSADVPAALRQAALDPDRPVVFFCHGPSCPNSFIMARAAAAAGWRNVFWYRGGTEAWQEAGLPTAPATPL